VCVSDKAPPHSHPRQDKDDFQRKGFQPLPSLSDIKPASLRCSNLKSLSTDKASHFQTVAITSGFKSDPKIPLSTLRCDVWDPSPWKFRYLRIWSLRTPACFRNYQPKQGPWWVPTVVQWYLVLLALCLFCETGLSRFCFDLVFKDRSATKAIFKQGLCESFRYW